MNILGNIKLSRVQLIVIVIVFSLIVFFVMSFSSDDINKSSLNSGNQAQQKNTGQTQVLESSPNAPNEYKMSQESKTLNTKDSDTSADLVQDWNVSAIDTAPNNLFSSLDDESLLNVSDILENSVVPTFLSNIENADQRFQQKAAIDVFVSRLPEGLADSDFQQINSLLRDYLPYDFADNLIQEIQATYRLNEQEQDYLSSSLANNKSPETMAEQIAIAKHLESLKGESDQQELEQDSEPSKVLLDWQKTQEMLEKIQSSSNDPNQDMHETIKHKYGSKVADDYLELSGIEKQWQEKYAVFLDEKNIISESGLSDEDKAEQIESLIQQHYEENEWAAVRAYDEMMQSQAE
jgi:hypothetical protein